MSFKKAFTPICILSMTFNILSINAYLGITNWSSPSLLCFNKIYKDSKRSLCAVAEYSNRGLHETRFVIRNFETGETAIVDTLYDTTDKNSSDLSIMHVEHYKRFGIRDFNIYNITEQDRLFLVNQINRNLEVCVKCNNFEVFRISLIISTLILSLLIPLLFFIFYHEKRCKCYKFDKDGNIIETTPIDY